MSRIGYNGQIHGSRPQPCPHPLGVPQPGCSHCLPPQASLPRLLCDRVGRWGAGEAGHCPPACHPLALCRLQEKTPFLRRFLKGDSAVAEAPASGPAHWLGLRSPPREGVREVIVGERCLQTPGPGTPLMSATSHGHRLPGAPPPTPHPSCMRLLHGVHRCSGPSQAAPQRQGCW